MTRCPVHTDADDRFSIGEKIHDPRKRKDVLGVTNPDQIERDYRRTLFKRIEDIRERLMAQVFGKAQRLKRSFDQRADGTQSQDIEELMVEIERVRIQIAEERPPPEEDVKQVASAVDEHNRTELERDFKRVAGIQPILDSPELRMRATQFARDNSRLIKDVDEQIFNQVAQETKEAVVKGKRHEQVAEIIQERTSVAESRAKLIARDQVSKLNGDMNRVRQRNTGIERYEWISAADARVRDSHAFLHGSIRRWDEPHPSEGHPGDAVQCRCIARGIVTDILDDLETKRRATSFSQEGSLASERQRELGAMEPDRTLMGGSL